MSIPSTHAATVYWRSDATTANWWDGSNPWYRSDDGWWVDRPDKNTPFNWPNIGPNIVRFDNNNNTTMNVNGAWFQVNQLIFEGSTGARTLNSVDNGAIDMRNAGAKIENNVSAGHTLNVPIALYTTTEINPVSGDLTISGVISNNSNWILVYGGNQGEGAGKTLTLSGTVLHSGGMAIRQDAKVKITGNADYTGNTEIDRGEFWLGSGGKLNSTGIIYVGRGTQPSDSAKLWIETGGGAITNAITVNPGDAGKRVIGSLGSGVATYAGAITLDGPVNLTANNSAGTVEFTGNISGGNAVNITGPGTVKYSGTAKTYTGATTINGGTLELGAANQISDSSDVTVGTGTRFNLANFDETVRSISGAGSILLGSAQLIVNHSDEKTYSGVMSGTGGLAKKGAGRLILSGANSYSGQTYIDAGVLQYNVNQHANNTGTINLGQTGGTAADSAVVISVNGVTINNNILVRSGNAGEKNIGADLGSGTVTFAGDVTLNDKVRLNAIFGGALTMSGVITNNGNTVTARAENSNVISINKITGTGKLVVEWGGITKLTGKSDYTGNTEVDEGELWLATGAQLGSAGNIRVGLGSAPSATAKLWIQSAGGAITNNITVSAASASTKTIGGLNISGTTRYFGDIALSGPVNLEVSSGGTVVFAGAISGGAANKVVINGVSGSGNVVFSNAVNTYTGNTEIDRGKLVITSGGGIASGSTIYLGNGTIADAAELVLGASGVSLGSTIYVNPSFDTGARTITSAATSGGTTISGQIRLSRDLFVNALSGSELTLGAIKMDQSGDNDLTLNNSSAVTIGGVITSGSGSSDLNKLDTGTLTISANNAGQSYKLNINNGTVRLTHANALGTTYGDKVNFTSASGTLQVGANISVETLGITINGVTANIDVDATRTFTVGGAIINGASPGSLTKTGSGTLVLNGANTYTGATIVNGGALIVNGSLGGAVTVSADRTISGYGSVGQISGAGLVSPGLSPGILTTTQVDPSGGTDFAFEFTLAANPIWSDASASGNDVLRITDDTTPFTDNLTGANVIDVYFNRTGLAPAQAFRGGFFTDKDENFTLAVDSATYNFYVKYNGLGGISFGGVNYYTLAQYNTLVGGDFDVTRSVVLIPAADFAGGAVDGYVQQFTITGTPLGVIPEPSIVMLFLTGLGAVYAARQRKSKRPINKQIIKRGSYCVN